MKKTIATLIAGLFATAAFAQTTAPAAPTKSTTSKPAAMFVKNSDLKATKADTKTVTTVAPAAPADTQAMQDDVKAANTHAKEAKASA
ncbi:MAG: hypothetical protein WCC39_09040, partial [Telluria sp.]